MLIIGLTGSIGMGKSTVAERFRERGLPVCDADRLVHELYAGAAAAPIEAAFPGTTSGGAVDRQKLGQALLQDPGGFKRIEAIVHPMVLAAERQFIHECATRGEPMAVLEVPLLLETGGNRRVDVVVVVSAPPHVQQARVLARPGMSEGKLAEILKRQLSDGDKRARADFVVDTGKSLPETLSEVDKVIESLEGRKGTVYAKFWA